MTLLHFAMQQECYPQEMTRVPRRQSLGDKADASYIKAVPSFKDEYQPWYSEAKALVRQLLPDRLSDFTRYYEKPKTRKDITFENYTIEDYLQESPSGSGVIRSWDPMRRFRASTSN